MSQLLSKLEEKLVKVEVISSPTSKKRQEFSRAEILLSAERARATFTEEELNQNPNEDFRQRRAYS